MTAPGHRPASPRSRGRRWLAAQKAGLKEAPCEVRSLTDEEVAEDNITLNIQSAEDI